MRSPAVGIVEEILRLHQVYQDMLTLYVMVKSGEIYTNPDDQAECLYLAGSGAMKAYWELRYAIEELGEEVTC